MIFIAINVKNRNLMKKHIHIFILLVFSNICYSQNKLTEKQIDSIYAIYHSDQYFNSEGLAKATELYYKSKDINYKKGQIEALEMLATIESGAGNFTKCYEYVKELKFLSLSEEDYESYIAGCIVESKILFYDHNYYQAKEILIGAKKYLTKISDPDRRRKSKIKIDIFWWWIIKESGFPKDMYKDSLVVISKRICADALLLKDTKERADRILFSANYAVTALLDMNRNEEAEKYLKIAHSQLKYIGENTFRSADYYAAKGDFEYHNKEKNKNYLDGALSSYSKALKISQKIGYLWLIKEQLYPKIAQVYKDKKDSKKQALFLERGTELKENIDIKAATGLNELKQKIYDNRNKYDGDEPSTGKLIIIGLSLLVLFITIVFLIYKRVNVKKNALLYIPKKNPEILSVMQIEIEPENTSVTELLELLQKNDESFYIAFLKSFPDFGAKLLNINPTMKPSDIEFCAMLKMNLDTKQIAQTKETSVKSVESKKYRLRKKLNIPSETDIYVWISKL